MSILFALLLSLTPQQKQLVSMVKQGDMIAADELAGVVCQLDPEARKTAAAEVRKRLKGSSGPAFELLEKGLDACVAKTDSTEKAESKPAAPATEKKAQEPPPEPKLVEVPKPEDAGDKQGQTRRPLRPMPERAPANSSVDELPDGDVDSASLSTEQKPTPRSDKQAVVLESVEKPQESTAQAGRRSIVASSAQTTEVETPKKEVTTETPADETPARQTIAPIAVASDAPLAFSGQREELRSVMTSYALGGGLVGAAIVTFTAALAFVGNGAYQYSLIEPVTDKNLVAADGRNAGEVYDDQVAAVWTSTAIIAGIAAAAGAVELGIGWMFMNAGSDASERL